MRTIARLSFLVSGLMVWSCGQSSSDESDRTTSRVLHQPSEVPRGGIVEGEAVHYTLSLEDAKHHYLHVRAVFPAAPNSDVELSLAVWTPGSYLVREYARNIEDLRVATASGESLVASKTTKNRWRLHTGSQKGIVVEYKVYCRELSVRTNFVDADFAVINGAPTFLRLVEDQVRAHTLDLVLPDGWPSARSGLASERPNYFAAQSYDELVDSPILAGTQLAVSSFDVEGVPHHLVQLGDSSQWDAEGVLADVQDLVKAEQRFWGVVPYQSFHFLNVLLGGGGGLEHLDSTMMLASPFSTRTASRYRSWLGLVAHEFFHTWNVKRLRPKALGPFDYETENYTDSLWIAEGITSYYADILMKRAGLLDQSQYLVRLGDQIRALQTTPGRAVQTLSQASHDAWIDYYRRHENSSNTAISYYTKGAVVAFLLDAKIRQATGSLKSLDDLMRLLYHRYAGDQGYTSEDFRTSASEVAGEDLSDFFHATLDSTGELDYQLALDFFGLHLSGSDPDVIDEDVELDEENADAEDEDEAGAWLGAEMNGDKIGSVRRGTPAYDAALNVDDEILAIDGYRSGGNLEGLLAKFRENQKVVLTIARHGRLRELSATLGKTPDKLWTLSVKAEQTQIQAERLRQWLAEYDL